MKREGGGGDGGVSVVDVCRWVGGGRGSVRDGYWVWVHEEGEGPELYVGV